MSAYGMEAQLDLRCNSTYRLRYAPKGARQQSRKAMMRSAYCLPERSEGKTKVLKQQYLPSTVLELATFLYLPFTAKILR